MSLYSCEAVRKLIEKYTSMGGKSYTLKEGGVGYGTVVLHDPTHTHKLVSLVIKEKYLNEWSSAHTIRKYRVLPECYMKEVERIEHDDEPQDEEGDYWWQQGQYA